MTHRATGEGKILPYRNTGETVQAALYNFDIDWAEVKLDHQNWLRQNIFPILRAVGSITLVGQASRSDDEVHNLHLSRNRVNAVLEFLRRNVREPFNIRQIDAVGEGPAAAAGQPDGPLGENEWYRSVLLSAWRRPDPPPRPPRPSRPPGARRFGWREVQAGAGEPPRWTIAGSTDTPVTGRGDALAAMVQFGATTLNKVLLQRAIDQGLQRETPLAKRFMAGHRQGGVLAVAICNTQRHGEMIGSNLMSVGVMNPLVVFARPRDAISRWRHLPQLEAPSQDPRGGGSLTYYFFWGTWV